jgi:hypothetical protein
MQKVIVSVVRFSCAFALYGVEKVETAISPQKGDGFPRAIEDLEATLESMTDSLARRMDRNNRETVKSASKIAEQVVERSCEGLSLIDPRCVIQAADNLFRKFSKGLSTSPADEQPASEYEPELAVEVLTASG